MRSSVAFGTKHGDLLWPIRGYCRVTQDQVWLLLSGQLEVEVTLQGTSMAILESQLEVVAASPGTKYGCFSAANSRSR